MSARDELGPNLPSRIDVLLTALELQVLAGRAREFAGEGPLADLSLALRQFDRMRALLGDGERESAPEYREVGGG